MTANMEQTAINTIRTLSMDAVQKAKSGHPGTPMALAPVAYALWQYELNFDPEHPIWPNRDRFVLSNGHASMLLYSLLHLTGVKAVNAQYEHLGELSVKLDDIINFRQLGSKCPGHPEYRFTSGVETTTGPLGQGIANSVGMAMASRWQAAHFNRPGFELFDYHVFAICGDGDLMEGVGCEAASLAGHLGLSNLCWIYDDNKITIEGKTDLAFSEDVEKKFQADGWNVLQVEDANNLSALREAYRNAKASQDKPTLIIVQSHIGYGAPNKQDTASAHGEPLGEKELELAKEFYGWPKDSQFLIPDGVKEHFSTGVCERGKNAREKWLKLLNDYEVKYPKLAQQLSQMQYRQLPKGWDEDLPTFEADEKGIATRGASGKVLNALAKRVPWMIGGSADLAPSTKTVINDDSGSFSKENHSGRNIHFGVREGVMGAIANGLSLSKMRPFVSTFFTFSDYARPAIRLSALMELPALYVFTHDSIGVGEDGPTHQPVEHLASIRAIPGMIVMRPADANEVTECWRVIMGLNRQPVSLILSRQNLPVIDREKYGHASGVDRGAYVIAGSINEKPDVILIATGSEVHPCIEAYEELSAKGQKVRVVSMPSWEIFETQTKDYKDQILPPQVKARVAVEKASPMGWCRYLGEQGQMIGMDTFGKSAPLLELQRHFGFRPSDIVEAALSQIQLSQGGK